MRKRLKLAWGALWGKYDGSAVRPWPPKLTQMINWRDEVLAIDSEGRIWNLKADYSYPRLLNIELVSENPVPKW